MKPIETKIDSRGRVPIPASIRQKLGLAPGSKGAWCVRGEEVIVRRATQYSSKDIHDAVFATAPAPGTEDEMKEGIRRHLRTKSSRH